MTRQLALAGLVLIATAGCALPGPGVGRSPALRLSELAEEGDATRRASMRLVLDGLSADERKQAERARGLYARALQVDSGNPYAYLALARHHAAQAEPSFSLEHLARSKDLLSSEALDSPRVEVHLVGLRGVALGLEGRQAESDRLLARAASAAPSIWGDGRLSAAELR